MKNLNKLYPHLLAILGFVVVSLIYFYPVLQGKEIYQSDIAQYTGMAKEQNDFRKETGEEPYWTNSAFGGMPTYQLGAHYPHNYIKELDSIIRFLPRPADYLFLYFLGFYILLRALKIDSLKSFFGALAFGLSTYLIIILGVGHNAKAHAIAYMPMVVAGVVLVFQRRYIVGGLLTMVAAALEISANHFQMTYYLLLLLIVIGIYFTIQIIKNKEYKHLGVSLGIFAVAALLAIGANATNLMATSEYAKFSTRSDSELSFEPDGKKKETTNAMSYDYITEYSYGIGESLNLIAPRLFGGSGNEKLGEESHVVEFLQSQQIAEGQYISKEQAIEIAAGGMPTYWGDQPIVAAPAYIGAVVFFLFVLAMFAERRKIKYAFLAGAILSLMLSWGKHFPLLTDFFINYVPMYNKFRAVSSIQVLLELCMPVLAIMGLAAFFTTEDKNTKWQSLWKSAAICLGLIVLLFFFKGYFDFTGGSDAAYTESFGPEFMNALKQDRQDFFSADLLRSFFVIFVTAAILWAYIKDKLKQATAIVLAGIVMVFDLYFVDKRYVDSTDFVSARQVNMPFEPTNADMQILQDTSHYRVFEVDGNMSSARASYFHKSLGGYHAAKPQKIQQLFDYQIAKNNIGVLNMLNVKYVIQNTGNGENIPTVNPAANGPAWFVSDVKVVNTADEEMRALDNLDTKTTAVINKAKFVEAAQKTRYAVDSTATIKLDAYEPNYLKYTSNNSNEGLAVFSEIYYGEGWNAYIDGKLIPHFEANYTLRALNVPAGKHTIEFKFEPQVVKTGSAIALISFIIMLGLIGTGIFIYRKRKQAPQPPKGE
jgi:hypothetical protein